MKRLSILALCAAAGFAQADTSLSYTYGGRYAEGGIRDKVSKHIFTLSNSTAFTLGTNHISLSRAQSDSVDPAEHGGGATEWALNETFAWTVNDNWSVHTGFIAEHKNTRGDGDKRVIFVGPAWAGQVGPGKLSAKLLVNQEWGNCDKCRKDWVTDANGERVKEDAQHHNVTYHPYLTLGLGYGYGFDVWGIPAKASVGYTLKDKRGHTASNGTTRLEHHGNAKVLFNPVAGLWVGPGYVTKHTAGQPVGGKGDGFTFNATYEF